MQKTAPLATSAYKPAARPVTLNRPLVPMKPIVNQAVKENLTEKNHNVSMSKSLSSLSSKPPARAPSPIDSNVSTPKYSLGSAARVMKPTLDSSGIARQSLFQKQAKDTDHILNIIDKKTKQ
jgi:hypothetical protein